MDQSACLKIAADKYCECSQLIKAQMVSIQNFAFEVLSDNHTAFYLKIVHINKIYQTDSTYSRLYRRWND